VTAASEADRSTNARLSHGADGQSSGMSSHETGHESGFWRVSTPERPDGR
jgi:hypothetical protein